MTLKAENAELNATIDKLLDENRSLRINYDFATMHIKTLQSDIAKLQFNLGPPPGLMSTNQIKAKRKQIKAKQAAR